MISKDYARKQQKWCDWLQKTVTENSHKSTPTKTQSSGQELYARYLLSHINGQMKNSYITKYRPLHILENVSCTGTRPLS